MPSPRSQVESCGTQHPIDYGIKQPKPGMPRSTRPKPCLELDHGGTGASTRCVYSESSSNTASSWSTAQSRSSGATTIGGAKRMVEP